MLFYFLCCVLSVTASVFPEKVLNSENGTLTDKVDGRIAGGEEDYEDFNFFSYQIQMVVKGTNFCSGVIIDKHYILTAAHCVYTAKPKDLEVRAGSRTRGEGMLVPIASIAVPKEFDPAEHYMDIAVLRTVNPFTLSRELLSTNLPDIGTNLPREITVAGWGSDGTSDELSDELKYVELPVLSNLLCQARYPEADITSNLFCAENIQRGGEGTCKGDGGAPATRYIQSLVGISTFTRGCGMGIAPSVFTNVAARKVREFIDNNTKNQEDDDDSFYYGAADECDDDDDDIGCDV